MKLYYGGSEIPAWRTLLAAEGIKDVSLSFYGMQRRVVNTGAWLLADKYPDDQNIFLDSGAYSVNNAEDISDDELLELSRRYQEYISLNHERTELISEFDALGLGHDYILAQRGEFYDNLGDKFIPVWHSEHGGLDELERLCSSYSRVMITETSFGGNNTVSLLNNLIGRYKVRLHGALTSIKLMKSVHWDSVGSTSWMSPKHYKDTTIWTGTELKRYPLKYKDQARSRHRVLFERNGFDADKIMADDDNEVLRLSLWSWQQFMNDINSKGVTTEHKTSTSANGENTPSAVDNQLTVSGNGNLVIRRKTEHIPVMGIRQSEDGEYVFTSRSDSMRLCNTCVLRDKCPGFQEDANCLYDIPISVRTPAQMQALFDGLIEMQSQRVMFMQMHEQLSGGYVDDNLSREIDRLQRLIKAKHDASREGFTLKVEASGPGQSGMISRIFGSEAAEKLSQIEHPVTYNADDIIVGEVLGEE